jgi:hypothetical protein
VKKGRLRSNGRGGKGAQEPSSSSRRLAPHARAGWGGELVGGTGQRADGRKGRGGHSKSISPTCAEQGVGRRVRSVRDGIGGAGDSCRRRSGRRLGTPPPQRTPPLPTCTLELLQVVSKIGLVDFWTSATVLPRLFGDTVVDGAITNRVTMVQTPRKKRHQMRVR